jgi:hypothetical protein
MDEIKDGSKPINSDSNTVKVGELIIDIKNEPLDGMLVVTHNEIMPDIALGRDKNLENNLLLSNFDKLVSLRDATYVAPIVHMEIDLSKGKAR